VSPAFEEEEKTVEKLAFMTAGEEADEEGDESEMELRSAVVACKL